METLVDGNNASLSNSNIIQLLKTFSKNEIREFDKFVHSPFLNNRAEVTTFFDRIKKYFPSFEQKDFTKEVIYSSLYPGSKYRDDVIRRLCSNLFKLAEDYLSYNHYRQEKFNQHRNLLEHYFKRDMNNFYLKQYKKTNTYLEENKLRNSEYFLRTGRIEEINRHHHVKRDTTAKKSDIQKQIDSVLKYSLISLLRLYTVAVQHINQFNKKIDLSNLTPILSLVETSGFRKEKAVEIYYLTNKLMTDSRDDKTFYSLKNLLKKNHHIFDSTEKHMVFVSLLTYCWDMNVKLGKDYSKDEFELILLMLETGILTEGERMYSEWFMYAFLTATKAKELVFAEKFIEKYKEMIPENERYNVVNHAYAELEMAKENYEKALEYLALPRYNNISEKLRANNMYLKIYYELDRSEQFFYQVDSFKHLLKNEQSLSSHLKIVRSNFVKFIYTLYKIRLGELKADFPNIRKEISDSQSIYNKWLLEKVNELEKSGK